jgi:hypothetical protein
MIAPPTGLTFPKLAALAAAALMAFASPAAANNDVAAAVAAGIVGVAIGASLSDHHKHKNHKHNGQFSPKPGVTCYDRQRACYKNDGSFASNMTWEFYR